MKFLVLPLVLICLSAETSANLPEDPVEYARWESTMLEAVVKLRDETPDRSIPKLGTWIFQLSQERSPNWEKGDRPVFHAAQKALLAISGHADFYKNEIIRAKAEREAAEGKSDYSEKANHFLATLGKSLETLSQLPSPESVRVLGDFLSDHSVNPFPIQDDLREMPLSQYALGALAKMPLADKPTQLGDSLISNVDLERDLPAWQGWYEEIKSGQRTFRFKGDPTEYDLDGPAPAEKVERIVRSDKRDAERAAKTRRLPEPQMEARTEAPENKSPILWISSAVLILVAVGFGWFRNWSKSR